MSAKAPNWLHIDVEQMQREYDRLVEQLREIEDVADRFGIPLRGRPVAAAAADTALPGTTVRDAVYQILSGRVGPMHISQIFETLIDMGIEIGGKTPKNTLFATIRGDKRFVNLGRNTWDLAERQKKEEADQTEEADL